MWLSCMVWLVLPPLAARYQGGIGRIGEGHNTKVPGTDWELIHNESNDIF